MRTHLLSAERSYTCSVRTQCIQLTRGYVRTRWLEGHRENQWPINHCSPVQESPTSESDVAAEVISFTSRVTEAQPHQAAQDMQITSQGRIYESTGSRVHRLHRSNVLEHPVFHRSAYRYHRRILIS